MANDQESIDFTKTLMEKMSKVGRVDKKKAAAGESDVSMGSRPDSYYTGGEIIETADGEPMSQEAPSVIPVAKVESPDEEAGIFELPPPPAGSETVSAEKGEHQVSTEDGKEKTKALLEIGRQLAEDREGSPGLSSRERRMALLKKIVPKSKVVTESSTEPPEKKWKSIIDKAVSSIGAASD